MLNIKIKAQHITRRTIVKEELFPLPVFHGFSPCNMLGFNFYIIQLDSK